MSSKRIRVLSCLVEADSLTFHALLPVLKKKDLVRLVGLLQQSMLEEQRRFAQLSQCLRTLEQARSTTTTIAPPKMPTTALVVGSSRNKNEEEVEEDCLHDQQPLDDDVLSSSSDAFKYRRSQIPHHTIQSPDLSPLMEMSLVSNSSSTGGECATNGVRGAPTSLGDSVWDCCASSTFRQFIPPDFPIMMNEDSDFVKKLSIPWDNVIGDACRSVAEDEEDATNAQVDTSILRLAVGDPNGGGGGATTDSTDEDESTLMTTTSMVLDDLETKMRVEQDHRDYLARELCLSQSRLAQLCAKNMKIYNLQLEHRRRYGAEDYQPTAVANNTADLLSDHHHHSERRDSSSPPQDQHPLVSSTSSTPRARKSLSTLHKERKLKELSSPENGGGGIVEPSVQPSSSSSSSKADLLRQQAFQSVLTDILAGSNGSPSSSLAVVEISPESGYNSSSSLKSPNAAAAISSKTAVVTSTTVNPKETKPNESELRTSRERILEQVRSHRRSSAPPVQHLVINCNGNGSSGDRQSPSQIIDQHRPLKSILKKRTTAGTPPVSRSIENGIHQSNDTIESRYRNADSPTINYYANGGTRSASCSSDSKRSFTLMSSGAGLADESRGSFGGSHEDSKTIIMEQIRTLTLTEATVHPHQQHSPVPLMAHHPGPSADVITATTAVPDSPGPFVHHVDYPSPVRNGSSAMGGLGKHGDLPDVVVLKLGSTSSQSGQSSFEETDIRVAAVSSPAVPRFQQHQQQPPSSPPQPSAPRLERSANVVDRPNFSPPRTDPSAAIATAVSSTTTTAAENDVFREWDPRPLMHELYAVRYEARPEEKRQRFVNMEGHLEHLPMNMRAVVASETMWRSRYFRTRDGRLQWFEDANTDQAPFGELVLAGAEVDLDKNANIFVVHNAKEGQLLTIRYPDQLLDKWRAALLSHASASSAMNFVRPLYPPVPHADENVCVIEIGSCSIRAGLLTAEPSLPQTYFPSIACIMPDGSIIPGFDALSPSVRHEGSLVHPITPTQPALNRYSMDLEIVKHLIRKIFDDLNIDSPSYQIMLSVPQNAPIGMVGDVMRTLLTDFGVRGVFVSRQPFLILYAYDVTTGVVVDFGDRLNIVPVIDGYVVQSAIVSLPYGGHNVSDGLRNKLVERNWTPYSFMSEVEKYILRYVMEKSCYVAADFDDEARHYDQNPSEIDTRVSIESYNPTPDMPRTFTIDSSRFTSSEGIFKPKRWGFDIDGLHKLIYQAIQGSPLDSRRILYRNIYLAGGASLIPGLVERLESELAPLVASSVQVRARTSPWRQHAAYIGAQILAGGIQFEQQLIKDTQELEKFIRRLYSANF